ncbi:uncharacterized protein [Amphiura filiformis]|uniref:uncharacterized protein n=1 Tax=Amphiura filiformis TaxID=82378 RepID=UPI003B22101A
MMTFTTGTSATRVGLIDTMVFGNSQDFDLELVEILARGQSQVNTENITEDRSILRCFSHQASEQLGFTIGQSSPGSDNLCPVLPVVINEVNVQSLAEDVGEFVELSSNGVAAFPLNNLNLVFWRGRQETAYRIYRIDGYRTDSNGLFLIGYQGLISPRPDMTPFPRYSNYIRDASNVISLHVGPPSLFYFNMPVTNEGLIDGIAYRNPHNLGRALPPSIVEMLTPGVEPGVEPFLTSPSNRDESVNRCVGSSGSVSWDAAHISPKAPNHCPNRKNVELVINEVSLVKAEQFIELWDKGSGYTSLDDFVVILYGEDNISYWTIPLAGYQTDSMGYFVIGVATTVPHAQFIFADGFLQTQSGAIALYRTSEDKVFPDSGPASADDLIDAVAYSNQDGGNELSRILTPDSTPIPSSLLQTSTISLSRCISHHLRNSSVFSSTPSTPKTMNDCPVFADDIFINEINVEQPGDRSKEFIELWDGGRGNTPLTYLCLVLFNGHNDDRSYATFDLDGYNTNDEGFFLIASDRVRSGGADVAISVSRRLGLLQNGPDAIAIYRAPSGAFPYDTPPTTKSLVDAIVYNTGDGLSHTLVDKLLPGRSMVLEDPSHFADDDESISRCHGNQRLDPLMFSLTRPTPGQRNACPLGFIADDQLPVLYINEISVNVPGQDFIELYNGGEGTSLLLNGLILVFFDGANQDRSYLEIDLHGARTNNSGYFLIGNKNVNPPPDLIIPDNIHEGPDAVVLYYDKIVDFPRGTVLNPLNIVDALVYGSDTSGDNSLVRSLAPGQVMAEVTPGMTLSRCMLGHMVTMSAFHSSIATPGAPNDCSEAPIILNEINLSLSRPTGPTGQYIELYDGGRGQTSLDDYILVLFLESEGKYKEIWLKGYSTNSDGFFLIGDPLSAAVLQTHFALPPGFIKEGAGAVALYKSQDITYSPSTPIPTGLVDAVIYGTKSSVAMTMMDALLPGQQQVDINDGVTSCCDWTISRCSCCETRQTAKFGIGIPTPLLPNNCSRKSALTLGVPDFIINEIKPRNSDSNTEFIELKGLVSTPLDEYVLVLFSDRGRSIYTVSMAEKRTDHNGVAVIGSHGMVPIPLISFPNSNVPIIPQGTGAVVLYRGVVTDFPVKTQMTADGVVDAVVFTSDQAKLDNEMTSVLTPASPSFYAGHFWLKGKDQSISRCQCCRPQSNSAFTLSTPTPYQANVCPSGMYSATIQMRLVNAAYHIWVENTDLIVELKKEIVSGINLYCQCGFNDGYLTDDKIMNGSVIYQATMLAVNSNQSLHLIESYHQYIHETPQISLHGTVYVVDGKCVENCKGNTPAKPESRTGLSPAEEESIVVLCIVFSATIIVSVYLCVRYRHKIWSYMKRTHDISVVGEFPVIFRRSQNDQNPVLPDDENENSVNGFANPVYMYQSPSEASVPRIVVEEHRSTSGRSSPRTVEKEQGASGRSSPRTVVKEQGASGRSSPKVAVRDQGASGRSSPRNVVIDQGASGRSSPRNMVSEQGASGRSSPRNVVSEQGASGRNSPRNLVSEQGASGRSSPRNLISDHSSGEVSNGVFRTGSLLSKAKKILDGKMHFENPLFGVGSSPAQTHVTPEEGNERNKENTNTVEVTQDTVKKFDNIHSKKDKKQKQPESFANPLYGFNTGPAELEVTVTQDENEAVETTRNRDDLETVDRGIQGEAPNLEGAKTASGDDIEGQREDGVKERFLKKFKRSHNGHKSKEAAMADSEPSRFVHM